MSDNPQKSQQNPMGAIHMVLQNNVVIGGLLKPFCPSRGVMIGRRYSSDFLESRIKMACELARQNHDLLLSLSIAVPNEGDTAKRNGDNVRFSVSESDISDIHE